MTQFRPMKGAPYEHGTHVAYPKLASFKINGIRGVWFGREFLSSRLITLPNRALQVLGANYLGQFRAGWDGELVWGEPNRQDVLSDTQSAVSTIHGLGHQFRFFVFDNAEVEGSYEKRLATIEDAPPFAIKLDQEWIGSDAEMTAFYHKALEQGYEGIVLRDPGASYKHGRGTVRENSFIKLKPHLDAEAEVVGFEELMHNANEAEINNLGLTKRSSAKDGKIPGNTLGALIVSWNGQPLRVGTFRGFTKVELHRIWTHRDEYLGKLAKFKYFMIGAKGLPLHPRLVPPGFRLKID